MTETKHTPAPWTIETVKTSVGICHKIGPFPSSSPARPETYACVYGDHINADDAYRGDPLAVELLANARLIAAAPALLEACKMVVAMAVSWQPLTPGDIIEVKAAIDKAEGRS